MVRLSLIAWALRNEFGDALVGSELGYKLFISSKVVDEVMVFVRKLNSLL